MKNKSLVKKQVGGAREGAGRPKGSLNKETIDQREAMRQFKNRVRKRVHRLFNAQASLAEGLSFMFRVEKEEGKNGQTSEKHVLVTDPEEIQEALDNEMKNGEDYYYISTQSPDNKAIDSMLDRTFGKAQQSVDLTSDGEKITGYAFEIIDNTDDSKSSDNEDLSRPT